MPRPDDGGRAERTERREKKAEGREADLRDAIAALLAGKTDPQTRKELRDGLRVNGGKFEAVLEAGVGARRDKEGGAGSQAGRYFPLGR